MKRRPKKPITMPALDARAIGHRIRLLRKDRWWRQRDLADVAGLSPGVIGAVEAGYRLPSRECLVRLSLSLRRTIDFLLLGRSARPRRGDKR